MPNETIQQLITAAVDGVLDARQEEELRILLAESSETASLYRRLLGDRDRLRSLKRASAPEGLNRSVLEAIRTSVPVVPSRNRSHTHQAGWIPYIIAGAVFLAVSAGSFWLTLMPTQNNERAERLALPRSPIGFEKHPIPKLHASNGLESLPQPREILPLPVRPRESGGLAVLPPGGTAPEFAPLPRSTGSSDVVGSRPTLDSPGLDPARIRLPLLAEIVEFDQQEIKTRLLADLSAEPAHRLDLFVQDPLKAVEILQTAARAEGLVITVDSLAQERMKRKIPSAWMIYTESLSAEEIVKLLGQLAVLTRKEKVPVLTTGHLVPAQAIEQRDLRDLLGLDADSAKRLKASNPKSLPSGTLDELARNLKKKGPSKSGILVTYLPHGYRPQNIVSKEVRTFLEQRGERKPNTVALMIMVRPAP